MHELAHSKNRFFRDVRELTDWLACMSVTNSAEGSVL